MNYSFFELATIIERLKLFHHDDVNEVRVSLAPYYSDDCKPYGYRIYNHLYGKDGTRGMHSTVWSFDELNNLLGKK